MGNFHTCGPNSAIVVTGQGAARIKVGQTAWAWWVVERVQRLKLELLTIVIKSENAETSLGVRVTVHGVAQIKVNAFMPAENGASATVDTVSIAKAAQLFMGESDEAIKEALKLTLEGHQRQIIGRLTVEELFKDREAFSREVRNHVEADLRNLGMSLCSYVVQSLEDANGYMASLGVSQTSLVKRDADEGRAKHDTQARRVVAAANAAAEMVEAEEQQRAHVTSNAQKQAEAEADRDLELKRAAYAGEVNAAQVEADNAGAIESARQLQTIKREQRRQEQVEETIKLGIAELKVQRRQKELEGQSAALLLSEANNAKAVTVKAQAEATRARLVGKAEADNIIKMGEAEAKVIEIKAEAYARFGEAATVEMLVKRLPEIAGALAKPLCNVQHLSFVSSEDGHHGGGHAQGGASGMMHMLGSLPEAVEHITGVDLRKAVKNLSGIKEELREIREVKMEHGHALADARHAPAEKPSEGVATPSAEPAKPAEEPQQSMPSNHLPAAKGRVRKD